MDINKKVHKAGRDNNHGLNYWIGVKSNRYASDGSQISISPPWHGSTTKIDRCLLYCTGGATGEWCDNDCTSTHNSVCEYDF